MPARPDIDARIRLGEAMFCGACKRELALVCVALVCKQHGRLPWEMVVDAYHEFAIPDDQLTPNQVIDRDFLRDIS